MNQDKIDLTLQMEHLLRKIESEGFDYALADYSEWKNVHDKNFHRLRDAYVKAKQALEDYLDAYRDE